MVEPESQWSQDFPDDVVEGTRQDSLATLSPDQTQPPQRYRLEDLPKFSFLDKVTKMDADGLVSPIPYKKLKSFVSTPSPAPPPVSNKTPGSTKRLGRSDYCYYKLLSKCFSSCYLLFCVWPVHSWYNNKFPLSLLIECSFGKLQSRVTIDQLGDVYAIQKPKLYFLP